MRFASCRDGGRGTGIGRRGVAAMLVATLLAQWSLCVIPSAVEAQSGKEIGKALLRTLIESQLDRDDRRGQFRPGPGQPIPAPIPTTVEMQRLRPLAASLAQESANFSNLLATDGRFNREIRQSATDALRLQASAAALQQRAALEQDHRRMIDGFRSLSSDWRTLSHQIQNTAGVSPQTKQCVERMNGLDEQCCQLLGIREQIDVGELGRVIGSLEADLRTLTDEIQYAPAAAPNRAQVVGQLRRLQEQTHHLTHDLADGTATRTLAGEYQAVHRIWTQLRPGLDQYQGQSIVRAICRIQDGHRAMHRLLRLPFPVDAALLLKMAAEIRGELTTLSRTITLEQLLALPDARSVITSTDAAFGCAENLADVLADPKQIASAGEAWFYLEEAWNVLAFLLEPIQNPETRRHAEHVEQSIDSLRSTLGVTVVFDQRIAAQRAASLHAMSERLQATIHQWLARPGKRDQTIETEAETLAIRCHELDNLTQTRCHRAALRTKCDEVLEEWQRLRPMLLRCDTEDRETLDRLTDNFIPELVKTRMMLED